MSPRSLLQQGLAIIADCQKQTGDIWDAHYGTASIAASFLAKSSSITTEVAQAIINQAEQMVREHTQESSEALLVESVPVTYAEALSIILPALDANIDQLHWVGHNVIYTAVSLLAIRELEAWGSLEHITHIQQLIQAFDRTIAGRSWIGYKASEVKRLEITVTDSFPSIESPAQLSAFILQELAETDPIYIAEAHHDLIGHTLTFSHALNILHDLGQSSLFRRGLHPLLQMCKVLRASRHWDGCTTDTHSLYSPVDRLPLQQAIPVPFCYTGIEFWQQNLAKADWDYGHHFKFVWSYNDHMQRAPQWSQATNIPFHCLIHGIQEENR